ncbi:hypothetical protein H8S90_12710 [Olivibacter sp. SDN3]|uniref:DUF6588 family protein n=1 Tax=Olivibacter sp. SDN3 TaxID=2764720 RepID=UPI0016516B48|nr:DUF6588 family protein [Olivibacter sp. SDN3]QNL47692.1 hypothetical protein H8S90_12710 [Olivibacter sp. SDN3]
MKSKGKIAFFVKVNVLVLYALFGFKHVSGQSLQDYEIQLRDLERFGNSYFAAYTNLFSSNFGFSLNQGWPGGSIPKKSGHISLSVVGNTAVIPINDNNRFIATNQLYQTPGVSTSLLTPSLFTDADGGNIGFYLLDPSTNNRLVNPINGDYLRANFNMMDGLGTNVGVTPFLMPQLSVSLGKSTEILLRALPLSLVSDNGRIGVSAWGGAVRHELSQWFAANDDPAFSVNILFSYMKNRVDFTPNGERFLTFNNEYFNTEGTKVVLSHETHTKQALMFFNYKLPKLIQIYAHGGVIDQRSNLGSDGIFRLNIKNEFISDVVDDGHIEFSNLFSSKLTNTVPAGGVGLLLGRGFLQTEAQYTYANTHIASLALRINLFKGD